MEIGLDLGSTLTKGTSPGEKSPGENFPEEFIRERYPGANSPRTQKFLLIIFKFFQKKRNNKITEEAVFIKLSKCFLFE